MPQPPGPSEFEDPYALAFAAVAQVALPGLPVDARMALADALEGVLYRPWSGEQYHPKMPAEMRTATFGDGGEGIVQWVVSDKQRRVIVTQVLWAGDSF